MSDPRATPPDAVIRCRRLARTPALALVVVLTAAWAPCLACERPARASGSTGLTTTVGCHGVGATGASHCGPRIRVAGPALRASGIVPTGGPNLLPPSLLGIRVPKPMEARKELPGLAPPQRPPLYLLHASLLA